MKYFFVTLLFLGVTLTSFLILNQYIYTEKQGGAPTVDWTTHVDADRAFSFTYRNEPDGYILLEPPLAPDPRLAKAYVLELKKDHEFMQSQVEASEGPPVISVLVLHNSEKLSPREWALKNAEFSNMSLIRGDVSEMKLNGAPAVRYFTDGLYTSDTVVATQGTFVYVFFGGYLEEASLIRRDFEPLLRTVSFDVTN